MIIFVTKYHVPSKMSQVASPVISFLIPLYNCGNTIKRCVDSLVTQFKGDYAYEIVIVNDGSTDNGAAVVDSLINEGIGIRLYSQDNHGVSYTRQRLLDHAAGKYIMFVDADDYLVDGVVATFIDEIEKKDADAIFFQLHYEVSDATYNIGPDVKFQEHSAGEFVSQFNFRGLVSLCQFLFRRLSITERFDSKIVMVEDFIFLVKQLTKFKNILSTDTVAYVYCDNPVSLTRNSDKQTIARRSKSYADAAVELSKLCKDEKLLLPQKVRNEIAGHVNYLSYISVMQCIIGGGDLDNCIRVLKAEGRYPYKNWGGNQTVKLRLLRVLMRHEALARLLNLLMRMRG